MLLTFLIPLILVILLGIYLKTFMSIGIAVLCCILSYIPFTEIYIQIANYILSKTTKTKMVPKLDFLNGIPEEYATFVVIPTIVDSAKKVNELMEKLEIYYIANKSKNIFFALLGDTKASKNEKEFYDEEVINAGLEAVKRLNEKYKTDSFPIFHFLYRNRLWNSSEKCYLGWERKRGLLSQFNNFLVNKLLGFNERIDSQKGFRTNTIANEENVPQIKYIITLDSDTNLVLESASELIGAMAHILNKPVLNKNRDLVIEGHALMQPRVGIDLEASSKSAFTKIYAGLGGVDSYSNAISDIYQDNFDEGIFTGKGIYDLQIFYDVLNDEIPENTVLSHDLLEGSYLRCALVNDIVLLDGYPSKYNAAMGRNHRWIRGDWQIIRWIGKKIINKNNEKKSNPLNGLSKFKILDNLRRSLIPIFAFILILVSAILKLFKNVLLYPVFWLGIITIIMPTIIDVLNYIIFKKDVGSGFINAYKSFSSKMSMLRASIYRGILEIMLLPHKAYMNSNAILKTLYRMKISKQNLLEWTTAEEAEKQAKTDILSYYKNMIINLIFGILFIFTFFEIQNVFLLILGALWIIAPSIMCYISKESLKNIDKLNKEDVEYLLNIGKKTWNFFESYINEENNFLPPDNYQEDRIEKIAYRTSSTNIGLGVLSVVAAYDLNYISIEKCLELLDKMLSTVNSLSKWNGHLYNWYDTRTLQPLLPRYISSVDSGNFIGYMYVLKQFLLDTKNNIDYDNLDSMIEIVDKLIENTDFSVLYDYKKRLFSIGFNVEENKLTDSYYDLLASEARQASLVAIAKKDIPSKHWNNLSRTLTTLNKYKGLISWSGTSFEYLMPNINIKRHAGSLLDESCKFMIMSQKEYTRKLNIPWGISEAAFNLRDLNYNYQYKAFGIPWLGLKRGLADDMVVSSYGLILALLDEPQEVVNNLKVMEKEGMYGDYGFYESIDYTASRLKYGQKSCPVKTYMAHHQGLILLSIDNFINNNILQDRFNKNPEIAAVDILLQERMPEKAIITKEKKEKVEKIKLKKHDNYAVRVYNRINGNLHKANVISNGTYTVCMNDKGDGFSKCNNIIINKYKETFDYQQGIYFYIKNINSKRIWTNTYANYLGKPDKYSVQFAPDHNKIVRQDGAIETTTKITVASNDNVEIRRLELKNNGNNEETLEITCFLEPMISTKEQDYAHPAFNNLFLTYEKIDDNILVRRKQRDIEKNDIYVGTSMYTENETIGELEYEIDKEKFVGRNNIGLPIMVKESKPLSKTLGLVTDSCVALKRNIKIMPGKKVTIDLIIGISESKEELLNILLKYKNTQKISETFDLSFARTEAESIYLDVTSKDIETYQEMLTSLVFQNPIKKIDLMKLPKIQYKQSELWKFGISGDLPILLIKIKDINDIYIVNESLRAYEFFRAKNINIDLVILNEEEYIYEQYVKEEIESAILNKQLSFLKNNGIFVLNAKEIKKEDTDLLTIKANLIIDASKGEIKGQIEEKEEDLVEGEVNIGLEAPIIPSLQQEENINIENMEELKYYNEYGGFSNDGMEYKIKVNKDNNTPTVWSHVMSNSEFGTVITDNLGGYTWCKNSRLNRLSVFSNNPVMDVPSESIYIRNKKNGNVWRIGNKQKQDIYLTYGFGYTNMKTINDGILQELDIFIPKEDKVKVNLLRLKNTTNEKKELKLVYYINPCMAEDEINSNGFIDIEKNNNVIYARNLYNSLEENSVLYVSTSERIDSYTGNKEFFIGNKTIETPEAMYKTSMDNQSSIGINECIAIEINIEIESYGNKTLVLCLGQEDNLIDAKNISYKYSSISNCKEEYGIVKNYWYEILNRVQIKTPLESMNIMLNGWTVYQTISARLWGKTGFYQSGGAVGFRDQLQDTLGLKYIDPELMRKQILLHASHQFTEGDVEHWWHKETKKGIRTRFSDDLLWLCYVTAEYINTVNDYSILKEIVPYIDGASLEEGIDEQYDVHIESKQRGTIYEHCIKSIEKSLNFGTNGLPKIGSGDWNDGFNTVGNKGIGESVWLAFFLYNILSKFIPICKFEKDVERAEKYEKIKDELKNSINKNAWDGRWFKRAFTDEGNVLGTIENDECKIDSISQSWSVISNAADNDKKYISMDSLEKHLVDRENGIIKLLDPPFNNGKLKPGYIKAYLPGVRENGGQYTHAAIWAIIALVDLGFGDKATEYFRMINPIEHSRTKEEARKYKVEPYVIAGDVYGAENLAGRGGWTWYTGSSSWFYKAGIEYILGLKIDRGYLRVEPCIPQDWKEYSIKYRYKSSIYNIKVKNINSKQTGINKFILNGNEVEEKKVKLLDDGSINNIEIIM